MISAVKRTGDQTMTAKAAAAGAMADEIADLIFLFSMKRFDEVHSKGNPASISSVEINPCGIA